MSALPSGWTAVNVGELAEINPKNLLEDQTEVSFVPMALLPTQFEQPFTHEKRKWGAVKKGYTHFQDGDVLLAKITPCFENGKSAIAQGLENGFGAGSTEYIVFRPHPGLVLPELVLALFKTEAFLKTGAVNMTGSVGQKRIPKDFVESYEIGLPPLNEQKRIADKLDQTLAIVERAKARLARVPEILKQFRQSVLAAATDGRLTEDWREGDMPTWNTEKAADVCVKVQSGGTPKDGFIDEPGIPFLKVYNIVSQKVSFDYKPQYVEQYIHDGPLAKSITQPGDVLMNIVGPPLGKVAIVPNTWPEWNINQAITLFRPSERITTGWLYVILCGGQNISEIVHETRGSAGQTNISLSQCREFLFPVPPIYEQNEIVRRVETLFALADRIEARYQAISGKVDKLTQSLLAKAFRGELVPQDPDDEPAAVLLDRIRAQRALEPTSKSGRRKGAQETV